MSMQVGFSIDALDEYEWPVDVKVPVINPVTGDGEFEVRRFIGVFKHMDLEESKALMARLRENVDAGKEALEKNFDPALSQLESGAMIADYQIEIYKDIWLRWKDDLTDKERNPIPYDDKVKIKLLGSRMIRESVIEAHRLSQGGAKAIEKN